MLPLRAMKECSAFPKVQHYWNFTIRLFSDIIRTLVGVGSYPFAEKQSVYSTAPAEWAINISFSFYLIHGCAKAGRPARAYVQQLCEDTGCSPEDLPEAMNDRKGWRERVRDIRASSTTRWWWFLCNIDNLHTVVWFQITNNNHP